MNNSERRVKIANIVGTHERYPRTPLTKPTLNAMLAYFTGEHAVKPALVYAHMAPGRCDVREAVAIEIEKRVPGSMDGWFDRLDYGYRDCPKFLEAELDATLTALGEADDQRPGAGEYVALEDLEDPENAG